MVDPPQRSKSIELHLGFYHNLTLTFRQPSKSPVVSLTVFLRQSLGVFLTSFLIPSANLLANSRRAPSASSDDAVGPHREFARRFTEGIEKLVGITLVDHRKKTRRLTVRMLEATGLVGWLSAAESPRMTGKLPRSWVNRLYLVYGRLIVGKPLRLGG
ncbi:hypothetical protein BHE74_00052329 [Ensete ventricosum]|nr:hypothetical protein GW17_00004443 [Ensete ventricosum]RWW42142.1 hypothetical protein BHE74_00052329 [Ensete ventricosum]RZR94167.1 hypothetical protein BHM03_00022815 [Ensete ventricosum]